VKDSAGTLVLVDPYFPTHRPREQFIHPEPPANGADLPAQVVVLTHSHSDHTDPETIGQIHHAHPNVTYVGPQDALDKIIAAVGVRPAQTQAMVAGQSLSVSGMTIHAVYGKPPAGDPAAHIAPPDVLHLGYVVEMGGQRLYFSGDVINTFANLPELVGAVAALKPDIGFLTDHPTEGEFPFFDGSALMAQRIGLPTVVPAHYQCFVSRNYDPYAWAAHFRAGGPQPLIIPHNSHVLWSRA
jgi:L-ascorbate metabolism protein UlaG (beta-lactamase superfamily)